MSFIYTKIAAVLQMFTNEHGVPNAISPGELALLMKAPDSNGCRLMLGRILTSERIGLNRELAKVGLTIASYGPGSEGSGKLATIATAPPVEGRGQSTSAPETSRKGRKA